MISKEDARSILEPYHEDLFECVSGAWDIWNSSIGPHFPAPTPRARANVVHDLMVSRAMDRFGSSPDVRIVETAQRVLLIFGERLAVRFKKLGAGLKTSNYRTPTANLFDNQSCLPGVPLLSRVTVGYRLNQITQDDPEVLVVFAIGQAVQWDYQIVGEESTKVLEIPVNTTATEPNRLVRPKKGAADSEEEEAKG